MWVCAYCLGVEVYRMGDVILDDFHKICELLMFWGLKGNVCGLSTDIVFFHTLQTMRTKIIVVLHHDVTS